MEEALCMSGPGSGGDCIGGDGVGEEQNHASGSLALRLHLEDFWIVQLSQGREGGGNESYLWQEGCCISSLIEHGVHGH